METALQWQRLIEIRDEILNVFYSDRDPDQVLRNPLGLPLLWRQPRGVVFRVAGGIAVVVAILVAGAALIMPTEQSRRLADLGQPRRLLFHVTEFRMAIWQATARAAADSPLLGVGPGLLWRELGNHYPDGARGWRPAQENAHSIFLQLAAEIGWLALAAWIALLAGVIAGGRRPGREGRGDRLLRLGALAYLATGLSGHALLLSYRFPCSKR